MVATEIHILLQKKTKHERLILGDNGLLNTNITSGCYEASF